MGLSSPRQPFTSDYFILEVIFPLQSFSEYIRIVNNLLAQEIEKALHGYNESEKAIKQNIEEANQSGLEGELWDEFVYGLIDEQSHHEYEIKNYYNSIYYSSILISLYSFFERKLHYFCRTYEKNQTIKINDLKGKGLIDQYRKYVTKVLNIDLSFIESNWNEIEKFQVLRNFIVHNELILDIKDQRVTRIKDLKGIKLTEANGKLKLHFNDGRFLHDLIQIISKILNELYNVRAGH